MAPPPPDFDGDSDDIRGRLTHSSGHSSGDADGESDSTHVERGPLAPYTVRLLLEEPAIVSRDRLLESLRRRAGTVNPVDEDQPSFGYVFLDHYAEYPEGTGPVAAFITPIDHFDPGHFDAGKAEPLDAAVAQTWDWDEAQEVVSRCRAAVLVHDFGVVSLDRRVRLDLFQHVIGALLEQLPVAAIHWLPAQRVVDPRSFAAGLAEKLLSAGPINVRLFKVEDGQPDEHVMDTRGLEAFGLPDAQCHFVGLDPGHVAALLFGVAEYLFARGDVLDDDHTIQGVDPDEPWACHREASLVEPRRTVIDLDAGAHRPK